ncbi:MAG: hypothetical protein KVP17_002718 [Porospora cf. gigantea B]|uniref:uncharacterized protein n=1 Tax=Porospora cf. gigantea B TaxID=2853592 RepID=UPI0035719FC1|nr:MAG: hypothetical protein KVP17_002718 [Porospora cf. gigantea B]
MSTSLSDVASSHKGDITPDASAKDAPHKLSSNPFYIANGWDWLLIIIGGVVSAVSGIALPLYFVLFGDLLDTVGTAEFDFNSILLWQLYLGLLAFGCCFLGATCLESAAEHQMKNVRVQYYYAICRQELGYSDVHDTGQLSSRLNQNCTLIREGLGIKLGQLMSFLGLFVSGFTMAFIQSGN